MSVDHVLPVSSGSYKSSRLLPLGFPELEGEEPEEALQWATSHSIDLELNQSFIGWSLPSTAPYIALTRLLGKRDCKLKVLCLG